MALIAGAAVLATAYLDAKHNILAEVSTISSGIAVQRELDRRTAADRTSVYYSFQQTMQKQPEAEMMMFEGKAWTWLQVELGAFRAVRGKTEADAMSLQLPDELRTICCRKESNPATQSRCSWATSQLSSSSGSPVYR